MIDLVQAVLLGLVQGITEFLPISSSAHLILLPRLMNWPDQGLAFDAAANTGTLVAVMAYFREDLWGIVRDTLEGRGARLLAWLAVASVPLGLAGLAFSGVLESAGRDALLIATTTVVFGLLLGVADTRADQGERRADVSELRWRDALALGLLQAIALVPGTSRSGITITGGLALGMSRELAARTSFLMAVPAGGMVAIKSAIDLQAGAVASADLVPLAVVFVVSAVSGWCVIAGLLGWLRQRSLSVFVLYRLALGVVLFAIFGNFFT